MDGVFVRYLQLLAWESPLLVVYIVSIVVALNYRRRYPAPVLLAVIGLGILLGTSAGLHLFTAFFLQSLTTIESVHPWPNWCLRGVSLAGVFLHAGGHALLLLAVVRAGSKPTESLFAIDVRRRLNWRPACYGFSLVAVAVFLIALPFPAIKTFNIDNQSGVVGAFASQTDAGVLSGSECLIAFPECLAYPAWWANPLFFLGLALLLRGYAISGGTCGVICLLLSLSYLLDVKDFVTGSHALRVGYWLWVGSMALLAASLTLPLAGFLTRARTEHQIPTEEVELPPPPTRSDTPWIRGSE